MAKDFNVSNLMEKGYIDLKQFIDYSSPTRFLSRGMQEQLKGIMALGIFEIEGTFIKKKGVGIPTNCPIEEPKVELEQSFQNLDDEMGDGDVKTSEVEMTESEFTKKMKKQQKKYDDAIEELNKYYLKVAEHEKTIHNLKQKLEEAQKEIDRLDSDTRYEDLKKEIELRKSRYESSQEDNTELKQDINRIKLAGEYFRPGEEPKISKK
ncbi:MAG TPA: hypothetical protein PLP73_00350 [Candidatus Absconditabacterales bacterium]|nr:hypothetical protein [Candidatus Absconditabacterales bacterium]HRU50009.1 hypothetical protein [Candidatus Absconditabacterales bacterium]